eukprot:CAMPEP_0114499650 /NCGR_PEP_ID=MMETSP0109-20121206/7535_1 /TAXON_ID=29199 /ORGANISM="Chlorarachnion reptans, Strain CCCM449" /LENGTH=397 /DNA_ID=CAMNT_0001677241 /DNA_START=60 /DNA_END=1250 /DNA_ORIENTATION=+
MQRRIVVAGRTTLAPSVSPSSFSLGHARRLYSLTSHPSFANTSADEAGRHLGLFVSEKSEWRARGLPWRIFRPTLLPFGGQGKEISTLEAVERLSKGQPVQLQRCRAVTVTPDFKALEGLATTLAMPSLRGLTQRAKETTIVADPTGIELPHGRRTTLSSFAELKLFSSIYNKEVPLPSSVASEGVEKEDEENGEKALRIAHLISRLMNRDHASGLEMFSVEDSPAMRFFWHFKRHVVFWLPAALIVVTPALASETVMSVFGLEAMQMFPFKSASSLAQCVKELPAVLKDTAKSGMSSGGDRSGGAGVLGDSLFEYSVSVAGLIGIGGAGLRGLWKTAFDSTPMGYSITAYDAFLRITRGEPVVLQQMMMHTFRVPFITTISYFCPYRPGDVISGIT